MFVMWHTLPSALTSRSLKDQPPETSSTVLANGHGTRGSTESGVGDGGGVAFLGSMLFTRCVSGTRVVPRGQEKTVAGVQFMGFGASYDAYPHDYLTAACALGLTEVEMDEFLVRLDKTIRKVRGRRQPGPASVLDGVGHDVEVAVGHTTLEDRQASSVEKVGARSSNHDPESSDT